MEDLSPLHVVCTQNLYQIIQESCLIPWLFHCIIWIRPLTFDKEIRNCRVSDVHWRGMENRSVHLGMHLHLPKQPLQPLAGRLREPPKRVIVSLLRAAALVLSPPRLVFCPRSSGAVGNEVVLLDNSPSRDSRVNLSLHFVTERLSFAVI